jgi:UDPglucose 6-dehydrogenase
MKGVGLDYRLNSRFLNAGVGFGGSCFHKDVNAIKAWSKSKGYTSRLLEAVLGINDDQAIHIVDMAEQLAGKFNELRKRGIIDIIGYDPKAKETAKVEFGDKIKYAESIEEALKDSECAILITEWDEFKALTPDDFKKQMKAPNLVDGRRIFDYDEFNRALPFRAIGRTDLE